MQYMIEAFKAEIEEIKKEIVSILLCVIHIVISKIAK